MRGKRARFRFAAPALYVTPRCTRRAALIPIWKKLPVYICAKMIDAGTEKCYNYGEKMTGTQDPGILHIGLSRGAGEAVRPNESPYQPGKGVPRAAAQL